MVARQGPVTESAILLRHRRVEGNRENPTPLPDGRERAPGLLNPSALLGWKHPTARRLHWLIGSQQQPSLFGRNKGHPIGASIAPEGWPCSLTMVRTVMYIT